jgi:hypothetical protein
MKHAALPFSSGVLFLFLSDKSLDEVAALPLVIVSSRFAARKNGTGLRFGGSLVALITVRVQSVLGCIHFHCPALSKNFCQDLACERFSARLASPA